MFEYMCGESTACAMSLLGAMGLALVGAVFGLLAIRGWLAARKAGGPRSKKPLFLFIAAAACFLAAGGLQHASTAVFGVDVTKHLDESSADPLGGDDDLTFDDE